MKSWSNLNQLRHPGGCRAAISPGVDGGETGYGQQHHTASQRQQGSSHKTGSSIFREKTPPSLEMHERSEGGSGVPQKDSSLGGGWATKVRA
jgi:hypothetical protein